MTTTNYRTLALLLATIAGGCDDTQGVIIHDAQDTLDNGVIIHDEQDDGGPVDNGVIVHDEQDDGGPVDDGVIVHDETDNDAALNLLARVEVQAGELLEIYEPEPGLLIVSGSGAPAAAPMIVPERLKGLSLGQLWDRHGGGAAMPAPLAEVAGRMGEAPLAPVATRAAVVGWDGAADGLGELSSRPAPVAAGYCDTGFYGLAVSDCDNSPWDTDIAVCLDSWFNGAWAQADASQWTESVVCPAQGNVVMHLSGEAQQGVWTVAQNTYRNVQVYSSCGAFWESCPRVRVDIEQASGDRFHFRFLADVK